MSAALNELPATGFLTDVSAEHRAFLACFGKFHRPEAGDVIIREGEAQESLYLILSGTVHIMLHADDREILLASFGPGDSLGQINLFDPSTASATAIARSAGLVWSLSRFELDAFLAADPAAGVPVLSGLLTQVSKYLRTMNKKLVDAEQVASLHNSWGGGDR